MKIWLMINNNVIKEYMVDQNKVIIGRDSGNDIQIDNMAVSREHACITREPATINKGPDDWFVEDLDSINGTFVNGHKISKKLLVSGDEITIGKYFLKVYFDEDSETTDIGQIMDEKEKTYRMKSHDFEKIFEKHSQ